MLTVPEASMFNAQEAASVPKPFLALVKEAVLTGLMRCHLPGIYLASSYFITLFLLTVSPAVSAVYLSYHCGICRTFLSLFTSLCYLEYKFPTMPRMDAETRFAVFPEFQA